MKTVLKVLAGLVIALVVLASGAYGWAAHKTSGMLARTIETHSVDFPIPFPLDTTLPENSGLTEAQASERAREEALARGQHLVEARYGCVECHGRNFGGGVMVDDPMLGRLLGPNITAGAGGRTAAYTARDWDRIVRHGVRPDGSPAAMPSEDFKAMTDEELSDIVTYIRSQPTVDNTVPAVTLGPLGKVLVATGALPLAADRIGDHFVAHASKPPMEEVSAEFGAHLAGVCRGCHGENLAGGPIAGGDPSWPPARNLTPHADGLAGWTYDQFLTALRESKRPDGTELREPMTLMKPYAQNMTETETRALWAYLQTVPPVPTR